MYVRRCYRNKEGKRHGYWALVESYRSSRGPRQRVVAYLGEMDAARRLGIHQQAAGPAAVAQRGLFRDVFFRRARLSRRFRFGSSRGAVLHRRAQRLACETNTQMLYRLAAVQESQRFPFEPDRKKVAVDSAKDLAQRATLPRYGSTPFVRRGLASSVCGRDTPQLAFTFRSIGRSPGGVSASKREAGSGSGRFCRRRAEF